MRYKILLLLFALLGLNRADAETYDIASNYPGGARSPFTFIIQDVVTGKRIVDIHPDLPVVPASTLKAVTSASVLSLMPHNQCFATRVSIDGAVVGGVLEGNIVVHAVGDPTLESRFFPEHAGVADSIAAAVRRLMIDSVSGTVIVDDSAVQFSPIPDGWTDEDLTQPYGASFSAINWRDNRFTLMLPSMVTMPHMPALKARMVKAPGNLRMTRNRMTGEYTFTGTVKQPRKVKGKKTQPAAEQQIAMATHDAAPMMQAELVSVLRKSGVGISDSMAVATMVPQIIYTYVSPTFYDIMRSLMFRSDNMMAEAMLRTLAPGKGRAQAIDMEMKLWNLRGDDTLSVRIEDGSGLSRNDRVTGDFMIGVLQWMAVSPKGALYASLFPRAGMEGTMRGMFVDTPLQGRLAMKTGTLSDTRALAGYLLDREGLPEYAIVVIANNYRCGVGGINAWITKALLNRFAPDYVPPVKKAKATPKAKTAAKAKTAKKTTQRKSRSSKR